MIAYVIAILLAIATLGISIERPVVTVASEPNEETEWSEYHADAYAEYADEFTALFNAMEYKRAKNGASMIRRPGDKSFRFVKKG